MYRKYSVQYRLEDVAADQIDVTGESKCQLYWRSKRLVLVISVFFYSAFFIR